MNQTDKKVLITGGNGFLGRHVVANLHNRGVTPITFGSNEYDLTNEHNVAALYKTHEPEIVIHLAAVVGGIGANRKFPGTFYYKNLIMGAFLLEYARRHKTEKTVAVGTICAYPKYTPAPFKEDDLWAGYPEETNAPYGIAKKAMLVQAQAYRQEFGLNTIYLLPVNLYGPGDNFNPESSHVIPALIKKCVEARDSGATNIECWGTGNATREFLYVEDAAEAIALATEKYNEPDPLNIGSGHEVPISSLVEIIAKIAGFKGKIIWNPNYPDGQPRRYLDTSRAKEKLGFQAQTTLEEGLAKTIEWYEKNKK